MEETPLEKTETNTLLDEEAGPQEKASKLKKLGQLKDKLKHKIEEKKEQSKIKKEQHNKPQ